MSDAENHEDLLKRLSAWSDGNLSPVERQRLIDMLRSDADARRVLIQYAFLESVLAREAQADDFVQRVLSCTAFHTVQAEDVPLPADCGAIPAGQADAAGQLDSRRSLAAPARGFLASALSLIGARAASTWSLVALAISLLLLAASVAVMFHAKSGRGVGPEVAQRQDASDTAPALHPGGRQAMESIPARAAPATYGPALPPAAPPAPVARLARAADCRWAERPLSPGDRLQAGQSLHLASGVAELTFDVGVRVVLQSPASLKIESADSALLEMGKMTAEIKTPTARGFKVHTPHATYVDQGTEFGVEVSPNGDSRVHVFQGRVDMALSAANGQAVPLPQQLMQNAGARLEAGSSSFTLVQDTGESFIRSFDQCERDRHTIAYWRFEDWSVGTLLPHTGTNRRAIRATNDSSFNGNDLFTYSADTQPIISGEVPAAVVPQISAANRGCLNNSAPRGGTVMSRDLYTRSPFSHAWPLDIQRVTPEKWTIEISVKPMRLQRGCQTFLVRDGNVFMKIWPKKLEPAPPKLVCQITAEDRFAVRFVDVDGRTHETIAAEPRPREKQWFHLAAVSNGRELRLYVDARDGRGYRLRAATALPEEGGTALGKGSEDCAWSIGRGIVNGFAGEWFQGFIDEVRVSDAALAPEEFLFAPK